jgi:hypothetical protein
MKENKRTVKYLVGHYINFLPPREKEFHVDFIHDNLKSAMDDFQHLCRQFPNETAESRNFCIQQNFMNELTEGIKSLSNLVKQELDSALTLAEIATAQGKKLKEEIDLLKQQLEKEYERGYEAGRDAEYERVHFRRD